MEFALNKPNNSLHSQLYIKSDNPNGDIELAKQIVLEEYSKYPSIIRKSKLKLVNLVSNLRVINNKDINKYVPNSESPDPDAGWMYIDIDYLSDENYFRQCVNHEIWHLYDFSTTGSFNKQDKRWERFNPKGFKYAAGGWLGYHSSFENQFHPSEGFITSYATLGIDEDKAETFMYHMTDHLKTRLEEAILNDQKLKSKVRYIQEQIAT